jgi:hypothetical protein
MKRAWTREMLAAAGRRMHRWRDALTGPMFSISFDALIG